MLSQNGEGPGPIFLVIYPFNFNAQNGLGSIFQPSPSFYPWIKCVFLSSVRESFLKKCWRAQFHLKMAKALTLSLGWFILPISMPTMGRGRFSSHFLLYVDKMCFPSSVCESFLKECWRAQFYLKMAKALTLSLEWFILWISMPRMDRGRFSIHFRLSVDKMCFSFFSLWEFPQKMLTCTILTQNGEGPDPIFLVIYPFNFNAHNGPGSISRHFLLSVDKMCFPSSVYESFLKKCWRAQFYLKMAKALTLSLGWYILWMSMPTMDRGRFSRHFLLSVDKMCFPSSVCERFSQKMVTCIILSQNGEGPDPFFGVIYPFNFNAHNGPGVDFSATSFYLPIKCVFPSSVCESFLKNFWRAQFYLKMAKALTLSLGWYILSMSMPTMDRGRFSSHFLLSVDNMCVSFFSLWEFSEKMLTCSILPQNGEELTRFFWWFILTISTPTMDRGRFSRHFLLSVDKMCFPSSVCERFFKKWWRA